MACSGCVLGPRGPGIEAHSVHPKLISGSTLGRGVFGASDEKELNRWCGVCGEGGGTFGMHILPRGWA